MAGTINKAIIVGNLGRDPEVRTFPSTGKQYCVLNVATSDRWRDRNTGENREKTEWHRVTLYNEHLAKIAEQYLKKGNKVYLEGQIETRKWQDQSGQDRYSTEIALRPYRGEMTILDRAAGEGFGGRDQVPPPDDRMPAHDNAPEMTQDDDVDDEIPF